jgi:chromosome segregation ATPase
VRKDELQHQLDQLEKARQELANKVADLVHRLGTREAEFERVADELKYANEEMKNLQHVRDNLQTELTSLRESSGNSEADKEAALARESALRSEISIQKSAFEDERKLLNQHIRELEGRADEIEKRIRHELNEQMRRIIAEAADEAQQDKARLLQQQAENFNQQATTFRQHIQNLEDEISRLQQAIIERDRLVTTFEPERKRYEAKVDALTYELETTKRLMQEAESNHLKLITSKNDELRTLNEKIGAVEKERNMLWGLGRALLNGIEECESLIHDEENRYGINPSEYHSPRKPAPAKISRVTPQITSKKAKTPVNTPGSVAKKLVEAPVEAPTDAETPSRLGKRRRVA